MARLIAPITLCVRNQTRDIVLCPRAILARSFRDRTRGLLGRSQLSPGEGILFEAAPFLQLMWMHTFFMRFPIDIVFLDRGNVVIRIQASLKPWHLSAVVFGARKAIELSEGVAIGTKTVVGDFISFREL